MLRGGKIFKLFSGGIDFTGQIFTKEHSGVDITGTLRQVVFFDFNDLTVLLISSA